MKALQLLITRGEVKVSGDPRQVRCSVECPLALSLRGAAAATEKFCPPSCVLFHLHKIVLEMTQDGARTLRACSLLRPSAICAAKRQPSGLQHILPGPKCSAQCRSPPCVNHVIQCHQPLAQMLMTTECGKLLTTLTELERNVDVYLGRVTSYAAGNTCNLLCAMRLWSLRSLLQVSIAHNIAIQSADGGLPRRASICSMISWRGAWDVGLPSRWGLGFGLYGKHVTSSGISDSVCMIWTSCTLMCALRSGHPAMPCTSTAQAWLMLRKCRACDLIVCSWRFSKLVLIGQRERLAKAHCIEADDFGLAGHVGEGLDGHRP